MAFSQSSIVLGHRPHARAAPSRGGPSPGADSAPQTGRTAPENPAVMLLQTQRPVARQRSPCRTLDLFPTEMTNTLSWARKNNGSGRRSSGTNANGRPQAAGSGGTPRSARVQPGFGDLGDKPRQWNATRLATEMDEFGDYVRSNGNSRNGSAVGSERSQLTSSGAKVNAILFRPEESLDASDPFPMRAPADIPIVVEDSWTPMVPQGMVVSNVLQRSPPKPPARR